MHEWLKCEGKVARHRAAICAPFELACTSTHLWSTLGLPWIAKICRMTSSLLVAGQGLTCRTTQVGSGLPLWSMKLRVRCNEEPIEFVILLCEQTPKRTHLLASNHAYTLRRVHAHLSGSLTTTYTYTQCTQMPEMSSHA